jgi:general L-amino acid transport system substrate-binding protein
LLCGVNEANPAFSYADSSGNMHGFDVDFCRATAAAMEVDVHFVLLTGPERFPALQSGEVDLLYRSTTYTLSRDVKLGFEFLGVNWYDGQGFMVRGDSGVTSINELSGAAVCVVAGSTSEQNIADYFSENNLEFNPVVFGGAQDVRTAYDAGRCDTYTNELVNLAAQRTALSDPQAHIILPGVIAKEPFGPLVREGDDKFGNVVRWVLNAIISAEELGITQANVAELQATSKKPVIRRLLGAEATFGDDLGIGNDWAVRAIATAGNYGEIFERHMGADTPIRIDRGMNKLWTEGGLIYSPPIR